MSKLNPVKTIIIPPGEARREAPFTAPWADAAEPAVIVVTGTGPVGQQWAEPSQPMARRWWRGTSA